MEVCKTLVEIGRRRQFLRGSGAMAVGAAAAAVAPARHARVTPALARVTYPSNRLANTADLTEGEPLDIYQLKTAWVCRYADQNGERHLKTFETRKTADAWLVQARHQVASGTHTPDSASLTIAEGGPALASAGRARGARTSHH